MTEQIQNDFDQFLRLMLAVYKTRGGNIKDGLDLIFEKGKQRIAASGISSVSAFDLATRQLLQSGELIQVKTEPEHEEAKPFTLTVEEYQSIPASTIVLKYQRQPEFKKAVDSLIARGLI